MTGPNYIDDTDSGSLFDTIKVQQGRKPVDVNFCSNTIITGTLDHNLLDHRIEDVSRQKGTAGYGD